MCPAMDSVIPRISANELGRFPWETRSKKRDIVRGQKFKREVQAAHYQPARTAILRSFCEGLFSREKLDDELKKMKAADNGHSVYNQRRWPSNVTAIRRFRNLCEKATPPNGEHEIIHRNASFVLNGVEISVVPDIFTRHRDEGFFSFTKLRISQDKATFDASEIVLLLMIKYASRLNLDRLKFSPENSKVVDCFSMHVFEGHEVSRSKEIMLERALAEIREIWPTLQAPGRSE
jgi:hypothetical protein